VIRTVALVVVVCLAGLGAIAAAAKKSPPPQPTEVRFPVVAGNKTDRLPLIIRQDTPTDAEKVDVVYVPPVDQDPAISNDSAPQKPASPPPPRLVSRHWHDPHDLKFEATKQKASSSKPLKKSSADRAPKQVSDVRECRSEGLDPLLRKLNFSPPCG
jgi:hypothetical protein